MPNANTPQAEPTAQTEPTAQVSQSQNATNPAANGNDGGSTYTPPATQADLDRIVENRLQRERSKYADYDTLKQKAGTVDTITAERDTWKQRAEAAEAKNATYEQEKQVATWANEVSAETGVPAELLTGSTKEEMTEQAKKLGKYINVAAPVVGSDGKAPNAAAGTSARDQFAAALEGLI